MLCTAGGASSGTRDFADILHFALYLPPFNMPDIRQLPTSVVNKIAAGEVIERPASVVKELVENSLDAGATRIEVRIEKGGSELIRITDNGCGIPAEQLPLAVASHATSKIRDADDLFEIRSLGFRGEALASIAEVSRLVMRSRATDAESGAELEVVGGRAEPVRPVGCPVGTSMEVRQLFFNTPVRQKFLRTTQTEMGHITEAFTRLALAHPQVHFVLVHGNRTVHDLPPVDDLRGRVEALFGDELAGSLIAVESEDEGIRLSGYVANPMQSRSNNRMQYLMLNGRFIRDRSLQHALGEAYRGLLLTGRYPICFLSLRLPPSSVDVNVHPTKLEVRFQDSGRIYSQLLGTLRTKFLKTDLVARASLPSGLAAETAEDEVRQSTPATSELFEWARRQEPRSGFDPNRSVPDFVPFDQPASGGDGLQLHRVDLPPGERTAFGATQPGEVVAGEDAQREQTGAAGEEVGFERASELSPATRALQIHNRYLVTETDEGLEVIDQHALHERILYELLREKVLAGAIESQRLLVPEPVDLSASEVAVVLESTELLARLGVEVEPFGGETILVSAYPAMLANFSPVDVMRSLVEKLVETLSKAGRQPEPRDVLDELLHMIACKAAIKYGDRLKPEEIEALLSQRHLAQDHHHCPHGRPTALVFTREQLDRQFKRI